MGLLDSYRRLTAMTNEMDATNDVSARLAEAQQKMKSASATMAAMNAQQAAAADPTSASRRVPATAIVTSAVAGGMQVNSSVLVELALLVMVPGGAPVPASTSTLVPQLQLGRLGQGASVNVTIDPRHPSSVQVVW
ncbi:hypothetical protein EYE40_10570 [Glaciihabitans arcticus]|uniref:Uncharacterized protein n=1 Tax=Glaciihabitans arcticus TaxID=2668039 RepID=A0A4Q9GUB4_9MICO|nr:hypothetical protein [Glaciihabitans arcticus]TBN57794.1 hypothetical protein EYE40_10570 [Glaciihabitans arcticus]